MADTTALAAALRAERSTTYRHYPVRLTSPTTLAIEWNVTPGTVAFLNELEQFGKVEASLARTDDLANLWGLTRHQQERQLLTLVEAGQQVSAISLARELHDLDLTTARALIEKLRKEGLKEPEL